MAELGFFLLPFPRTLPKMKGREDRATGRHTEAGVRASCSELRRCACRRFQHFSRAWRCARSWGLGTQRTQPRPSGRSQLTANLCDGLPSGRSPRPTSVPKRSRRTPQNQKSCPKNQYEVLPSGDAPQTRRCAGFIGARSQATAASPSPVQKSQHGCRLSGSPQEPAARGPTFGQSEHFPAHGANPRDVRTAAARTMGSLQLRPFPVLWRPWGQSRGLRWGVTRRTWDLAGDWREVDSERLQEVRPHEARERTGWT